MGVSASLDTPYALFVYLARGVATGAWEHALGTDRRTPPAEARQRTLQVSASLQAVLALTKQALSHERACFIVRLEGLEPPAFWSAIRGGPIHRLQSLLYLQFLGVFLRLLHVFQGLFFCLLYNCCTVLDELVHFLKALCLRIGIDRSFYARFKISRTETYVRKKHNCKNCLLSAIVRQSLAEL